MSSDRCRGGLYVISAPSGAGKTSLVRALMDRRPNLALSVSYTTRAPRPGEVDGLDYHFVDRTTFERMRRDDAFLEWAEVFGNGYGTGVDDVEKLRNAGKDVVLEIDWQGARQIRDHVADAITIFILPPSRQALEQRLVRRGTDSHAVIEHRMAEAVKEMSHWQEYDFIVVNDEFEHALHEIELILDGRGDSTLPKRNNVANLAQLLLASGPVIP